MYFVYFLFNHKVFLHTYFTPTVMYCCCFIYVIKGIILFFSLFLRQMTEIWRLSYHILGNLNKFCLFILLTEQKDLQKKVSLYKGGFIPEVISAYDGGLCAAVDVIRVI